MKLPAWAKKEIAGVPAWAWVLGLIVVVAIVAWLRSRAAAGPGAEFEEEEAFDPLEGTSGGAGPGGGGMYETDPSWLTGIASMFATINDKLDNGLPTGDGQIPPEVLADIQKRARLGGRIAESKRLVTNARVRRGKIGGRISELRKGGVSPDERARLKRLRERKQRAQARVERRKDRLQRQRKRRRALGKPPPVTAPDVGTWGDVGTWDV